MNAMAGARQGAMWGGRAGAAAGPWGAVAGAVLGALAGAAAGAYLSQQAGKATSQAVSNANDDADTTECQTEQCRKRRENEWHHEMPQQFRGQFARAGIDIDAPENGRVIPRSIHRSIHARGYNRDWAAFFRARPNVTASAIMQQRSLMVQRYGLDAFPRPSGRYNIL